MNKIAVSDLPEILQNKVNEYLNGHVGSTILSIRQFDSTPYKDKEISVRRHVVYIEYGNLMTTLSFRECSIVAWTDREVSEEKMISGDIIEFVKHSAWFEDIRKKDGQ